MANQLAVGGVMDGDRVACFGRQPLPVDVIGLAEQRGSLRVALMLVLISLFLC